FCDGLFALLTAIFPSSPAILDFEMFFDRCLHIIVAVAIVLDWHTGAVEFPACSDVIAAAAIVVGVFSAHCAVGLGLDSLGARRVTLNKNFVGAALRRQLPACRSK